ncbi:unnamed protein product [Durusdinium trenchii]|uniref:Uncharacterized protein n=1 Tax=Durusdinium trenchii TaxID=1381693 RepID=A0ABP0KCT2_9DINO
MDSESPVKPRRGRRRKRRLEVEEVPERSPEAASSLHRPRGRLRKEADVRDPLETLNDFVAPEAPAPRRRLRKALAPDETPHQTGPSPEADAEDADPLERLNDFIAPEVVHCTRRRSLRIAGKQARAANSPNPELFDEVPEEPRSVSENEEDDEAAEEFARSILNKTSKAPTSRRGDGVLRTRRKATSVPRRIIYAEEVPWPVRKKNTAGEDSDSEVERACRQERCLAEMRRAVEKGRVHTPSSHDADLRSVRAAALAPSLSFDWAEADSKEGSECVLEVLPPENRCPRQLLKEQLEGQRRKELAKGFSIDPPPRGASGSMPGESVPSHEVQPEATEAEQAEQAEATCQAPKRKRLRRLLEEDTAEVPAANPNEAADETSLAGSQKEDESLEQEADEANPPEEEEEEEEEVPLGWNEDLKAWRRQRRKVLARQKVAERRQLRQKAWEVEDLGPDFANSMLSKEDFLRFKRRFSTPRMQSDGSGKAASATPLWTRGDEDLSDLFQVRRESRKVGFFFGKRRG